MKNTNDLYNDLMENGGFTVDSDGNSPDSGFMVAKENFESILPLHLVNNGLLATIVINYAKNLKSSSDYIGAWIDDNKVYFDISERFTDLQNALNVGRDRNQIAIFNIGEFAEIRC